MTPEKAPDSHWTDTGAPHALLDLVTYQPGAVVSRTLVQKGAGTATVFAFDAGAGLSEHTSPYDALVHVLEGTAEVTLGGTLQRVEGGQVLLMPAGVPHALRAPNRFKMLLFLVRE